MPSAFWISSAGAVGSLSRRLFLEKPFGRSGVDMSQVTEFRRGRMRARAELQAYMEMLGFPPFQVKEADAAGWQRLLHAEGKDVSTLNPGLADLQEWLIANDGMASEMSYKLLPSFADALARCYVAREGRDDLLVIAKELDQRFGYKLEPSELEEVMWLIVSFAEDLDLVAKATIAAVPKDHHLASASGQ